MYKIEPQFSTQRAQNVVYVSGLNPYVQVETKRSVDVIIDDDGNVE